MIVICCNFQDIRVPDLLKTIERLSKPDRKAGKIGNHEDHDHTTDDQNLVHVIDE